VKLADATAIGLALGQAIGWAGALVQGSNYGVLSDSPVAVDLPDLYGLVAPRFPVQHAEIILFAALGMGLIVIAFYKPRAGMLFRVYGLIASTANFVLGFQRGDETLGLVGLRIDQWIDAASVVVVLLFWLLFRYEGNVGINQ
jgi:prolipoprotein diacylglyceryltransferase